MVDPRSVNESQIERALDDYISLRQRVFGEGGDLGGEEVNQARIHMTNSLGIESPLGYANGWKNASNDNDDSPNLNYSGALHNLGWNVSYKAGKQNAYELKQHYDTIEDGQNIPPGYYVLRGNRFVRVGNTSRLSVFRGEVRPKDDVAEFYSDDRGYMFVSSDPSLAMGYAGLYADTGDNEEGQLYMLSIDPKTHLNMAVDDTTREPIDNDGVREYAEQLGFDVIEANIGGIDGHEAIVRDPGQLTVDGVYKVDKESEDNWHLEELISPRDPEVGVRADHMPREVGKRQAIHNIEIMDFHHPPPKYGILEPKQDNELKDAISEYRSYKGPYEGDHDLVKKLERRRNESSNLSSYIARAGRGQVGR